MKTRLFFLSLFLSFGLVALPSLTRAESTTACTMQYDPVCGAKQVQCVTTPCYPVYETYGNSCMLGADKNATFIHEGECTESETGPVMPTEPYTPPKGCIAWFDGCNHCSLGSGGAMCTLMACQGAPQPGYCTAYEKPTPTPTPEVTPTPTQEETVGTTTATEPTPTEEPGFFASIWITISSWFTSLFSWI
jgi:hypothetical protein